MSDRAAVSDERLRDALEGYARAELAPDPASIGRTRERLLAAYRAARLVPARPRARTPADRGAPPWRRWPRPLAALAVGLALVVATAGLVAAGGGPGQPFYRVRLALEGLTVPSQPGQERFEAELVRLQARLAEAEAAGDRGDSHAVSDAVAAYEETLSETLAADGRDEGRTAKFLSALDNHVTVLEGLEQKVPDPAREAIRHALDRAGKARDALQTAPGRGGENPGNGAAPGGGGNGNPGHTPGGGPPGDSPGGGNP